AKFAGHGLIPKLDGHAAALELAGRGGDAAYGRRRASLPADDASELARRHRHLDDALAAVFRFGDADVFGTSRERAGHDLDDVTRAAHAPSPACADASAVSGAASGARLMSVRTVSDGCAPFDT